jgi:polysaccharide export outer membrane protein
LAHSSLIALAILVLAPASSLAAAEADTTAMDWSLVPEYHIVPGDKLVLDFGPNPDAPGDILRTVTVRPDGRISVFPVGDVVAAGRTPRQLEAALVGLLAGELKQPRVTVDVSELAGNMVHVLGRVNTPGSVKAGPFFTVSQAIAMSGGFADDAARNSVLVFHRDGARTLRVTRVRLERALKRGALEGDVQLSAFDIVFVPRSSIGNVDVFARQFFEGTNSILGTSLIGWELFNLDKVFVGGKLKTQ